MTQTSSTSQPTLDGTPTDPVTRRILQARSRLIDPASGTVYLGDSAKAFDDLVVWRRVGRSNQLVTKDSVLAVEKAEQAKAAAESDGSAHASNTVDTPAFDRAILSAIVTIEFDNCWLTPCGYWKGPSAITKKFEDLKFSFNAKGVDNPALANDFDILLANAASIMDSIALGGAQSKGFLVSSRGARNILRFRHNVFEPLESACNEADSDTASDSEDSWTMANWPVLSAEAQAECRRMASTHRPVPLPAYDIQGELISPERCRSALAGAVARVNFTLTHWFIDSKSDEPATNSYVADISSIRVLVNPPSQVMSPKKRKTARRDPGEGSPSKRMMRV